MWFGTRWITVAVALFAQMVAAQSPSALIRINSMSIGEGHPMKTIGGYATIPPEAQPELCHLSLQIGDQSVCRWFGEPGSRQIRFEVTLPTVQLREALLKLSDRPLSIRSREELERRPGSTFAELKLADVRFPQR